MYEGKNIHYSPVDNKPLCSFSQKQCNQRRLNGYAFCVRHILEDPTAPFRRCAYVAKSSQHLCTQAIPQGEQRQYCNNHMQVLGMLPRRERKPKKEKDKDKDNKDKDNLISTETKMTFGDRMKSKKLTLPKTANSPLLGKILNPVDDPDDPYAFHDAAPEVSPVANSVGSSGAGGIVSGGVADVASRSPYPQSLPSPSQSRPVIEGMTMGGISKAKLYPELAEKLEKVRPSSETKTKSRARSSRTLNKLQTKIAQNKIKDKLRKSQESNHAELSPVQVASPERLGLRTPALLNTGILGSDFGSVPGTDVNSVGLGTAQLHSLTLPSLGLASIDSAGPRSLGLGVPGATHLLGVNFLNQGSLSSQLLSPLHSLPPPYPGLPVHREPHFSPTHGQHGQTGGSTLGQTPVENIPNIPISTSLSSLSPLLSFSQASSLSSPLVSPAMAQSPHLYQQPQQTPHSLQSLPPHQHQEPSASPLDNGDLPFHSHHSSVLNQSVSGRRPQCDNTVSAFPQASPLLTSKQQQSSPHPQSTPINVSSPVDLPPPPPYIPCSRGCCVPPTSVSNHSSVLLTRVQRPKGVLTEKEAHCRLKSDDAVKLYGMYVHQRINNHVFVNSCMSLCASDEEENSDEDMKDELLPYQIDWKVLSDDEEDNELEEDGELPSDLRMVKLGVTRARYRRHCTQTKHATRINTKSMAARKKFTLTLIKLAKENPSTAAFTLSTIYNKPLQWPLERKHKHKAIWRKVCRYKDGADKQCTVMCLPYTNHCRKHVMYNVDQQLFQFCTAKNTDNTQCCMPVIDIRHDFPLCFPHALQAEHQQKEEVAEVKKRPRKKTKPPALTRPPRKGKKKKGKNMRPQKPMPPDKPVGDISMPESEPIANATSSVPLINHREHTCGAQQPSVQSLTTEHPMPPPAASISQVVPKEKVSHPSMSGGLRMARENKHLEHLGPFDLDDTLSPDFDKPFELPLEQASRLLEDQDFENFPDDAFNDIFSMAEKNGEPDALAQENEKLERQLAAVTDNVFKAKDTLEKLLNGDITMEDVPEQDTKQLAEVIALNLPGFSVDSVHQAEITTSSAAPALDPFSVASREHAIGGMAMSLQHQPQMTQALLTEFCPLVTAVEGSRSVCHTVTSMGAFLPPGTTTVNGIAVSQGSSTYNQAMLASLSAVGYAGSSTLSQQSSNSQVYQDSCLPQGYHMVHAGSQSHLTGFPGLQGIAAAAHQLSAVGGDLSVSQQQAMLARNVCGQQARATASPSPQVISRQMEVGSGGLHSQQVQGSVVSCASSTVGTMHSQPGTSTANAHPQLCSSILTVHPLSGSSLVSAHHHQGTSTAGLSSQLQAQSVLATQLSSGAHATWAHAAALQQQVGSSSGYHSVNGFPNTAQLQYTNVVDTVPHTLASKASLPPKYNPLVAHVNNVTLPTHVSGNATVSLSSLSKHEHHLGTTLVNTMRVNAASSPPMVGLKQDPRIAALTQHSRAVGRSGSPGVPGFGPVHSPPPSHSPQTLSPFSSALPAYQGSSTGS